MLKFFDTDRDGKLQQNIIFLLICLTGSGTLRRIQYYFIEAYLMCASSPRLEQMRTATASRITTAITELEIAAEIFQN